jgi:hypothetical protein
MFGLIRLAQTIAALAVSDELPPLEWTCSGGEHPRDEVWAASEPASTEGTGWVISRHDGGESWDFLYLDHEGEATAIGFSDTVAEAKGKISRVRARLFGKARS